MGDERNGAVHVGLERLGSTGPGGDANTCRCHEKFSCANTTKFIGRRGQYRETASLHPQCLLQRQLHCGGKRVPPKRQACRDDASWWCAADEEDGQITLEPLAWCCGRELVASPVVHGSKGFRQNISNVFKPTPMIGLPRGLDVLMAACGDSHMLVLLSDGSVFSAGSNIYGQLGNGTVDEGLALAPVSVFGPSMSGVRAISISTGSTFSAAIAEGVVLTSTLKIATKMMRWTWMRAAVQRRAERAFRGSCIRGAMAVTVYLGTGTKIRDMNRLKSKPSIPPSTPHIKSTFSKAPTKQEPVVVVGLISDERRSLEHLDAGQYCWRFLAASFTWHCWSKTHLPHCTRELVPK